MSRYPLILSVVVALASLLAPAAAADGVTVSSFTIGFSLFNTCTNEDVHFRGTVHVVIDTTPEDNHGVVGHSTEAVMGEGQTTGAQYVFDLHQHGLSPRDGRPVRQRCVRRDNRHARAPGRTRPRQRPSLQDRLSLHDQRQRRGGRLSQQCHPGGLCVAAGRRTPGTHRRRSTITSLPSAKARRVAESVPPLRRTRACRTPGSRRPPRRARPHRW